MHRVLSDHTFCLSPHPLFFFRILYGVYFAKVEVPMLHITYYEIWSGAHPLHQMPSSYTPIPEAPTATGTHPEYPNNN